MSIRPVLVAVPLCLFLFGCNEGGPGVNVGNKAPEINSQDANGVPLTLSQFQGKVVLLDFWATWCGPCRELIPHEKDIYRQYDTRPFTILGVSRDRNRDDLKNFIDREKLPWPNIFDGSGNICDQWNIRAFPTFVLIDHKGIVIGRWEGGDLPEIQNAIEKAIHEAEKK